MSLAVTPLTDVSRWARSSGLEIVILVVGAILLARLASWVGLRVMSGIDRRARESDELVRSEAAKHRHAMAQVVTWTVIVLIYLVAGVLILQRLGVPLAGLLASATVAGVALGFGAQRVIQDVLAGFFIITERQYGFGDVIRLTGIGIPEPVTGTVEEVTLRTTRIRTVNGEVVITPNGGIAQVTNLSRDWARALIDVPVPTVTDINEVTDILRKVGEDAYDDDTLRPLLLDPPTVMGVESIEVEQLKLRVVARTLPGKQFDVGRELRARIARALRDAGINVPAAALGTGHPTGAS